MIDLFNETTISLLQGARLLPVGRRGSPVSFQCVLRWVLDGAKGPDGQRVRLEAAKLGARWVTSKEAIQRFCDRLTPLPAGAVTARTPRQRQRQADADERELERLGI
jgi:hypothetical protein